MWTHLSIKTTQFSRFSETLTSSSKWLAVSAKLSLGPIIWLANLNQRSYPYHVSTPRYMVDNFLSHSLLPTSIFYLTCNEIKIHFFCSLEWDWNSERIRTVHQLQQQLELYASNYIKKAKIDRSLPLASTWRTSSLLSLSLCIHSLFLKELA